MRFPQFPPKSPLGGVGSSTELEFASDLIDQPTVRRTDSRQGWPSSFSFHLNSSARLFVLRWLSSVSSTSCSRHATRKQPSLFGTVARSFPLRPGVAGSVVNPLSERMMGLLEECARRRAGGRPQPRTMRTDGYCSRRLPDAVGAKTHSIASEDG